jgi:ElaB/YqjD/DUF883 family membrane-anchored ribosome-binding protein
MPTDNPQVQAASARVNERIEQGAQRLEQGVQSATTAAIEQVREVRERAESGIEQQRAAVAQRVRRLGEAIRHTSDQLSREDQFAQSLLDNASSRVQSVAEYIDQARLEDVAQDVQTFARRQPAVFFGGAFLIGLALGRFAKSSGSSSAGRDEDLYEAEVDLPAPARKQSAQRAPGYDLSSSATPAPATSSPSTSSPSTSTAVGSAAGTDVSYSAPKASEPPKPQVSTASTAPRATEPGQGNKS